MDVWYMEGVWPLVGAMGHRGGVVRKPATFCLHMIIFNDASITCLTCVCVCVCVLYPHGGIVNLLPPASTQCSVGAMCVPIELLSAYFNLPPSSVCVCVCVCVQHM